MCGIVGIYSYGEAAPPVDRAELLRMRDRMTARGPDGCGEWYSPDRRVGLGHRRLAIIDLSQEGAQPMTSADGSLVITYNGEIYNYKELRAGLEQKGYRFRSSSDTEVLLHLYAEKGREMVHELRGMYAFAIYDACPAPDARRPAPGLFLARDPFGIKPLYVADDGRTFRFASQVKALLAGGKTDTSPEPAGHVGFFLWGHIPEPYTLYKGIRSLPAGHWMWVHHAGHGLAATNPEYRIEHSELDRRFCSIHGELAEASPALQADHREQLRAALLDTVRSHLVADVPVGVFLSAGLDSTTLAALATEVTADRLHSVTLGFREFQGTADDEVPLAETVAKQLGADHRTVWVERHDFHDELAVLLDAMDQPTTDGVNSYYVSRAAVTAGLKVALSGVGGDELFGGYPSFQQVPRMVRALKPLAALPGLGRAYRIVSAPLLKRFTSPKYAGLLEYGGSYGGAFLLRRGMFMPWELPEFLDGELVRDGWRELETLTRLEQTVTGISSPHLKVSAMEMVWYMRNQLLRDTDWASMAHSLEVRTPLVDLELLRKVTALNTTFGAVNKLAMASTPLKPLPDSVINRQKTGFSVPVRQWLWQESDVVKFRGLRGWALQVYGRFNNECGER